jgi:hypothetical protein
LRDDIGRCRAMPMEAASKPKSLEIQKFSRLFKKVAEHLKELLKFQIFR